MATYIYALVCPIANAVRYVGKTESPNRRLAAHISRARSGQTKNRTAHWIRKILDAGLSPGMEILEEVGADKDWRDVERRYIAGAAEFGWSLTNSTPGGDGIASLEDDPEAARRRVESWRQTMALPEVRERWMASQAEAHQREECRKAKAVSAKAAWSDPEKRARFMDGMAAPEGKTNRGSATKARYQDSRQLAQHSERMKKIWSTPERREEQRQRSIALHGNAEIRARRAVALKAAAERPETQARMSAAAKEINARPEVKAARSAAAKRMWQEPGFSERIFTEAARQKMSESAKRRWAAKRENSAP
jgi:hypothetical protein